MMIKITRAAADEPIAHAAAELKRCLALIDKTAQTAYRALYQTEGEFFHDDARTLNPNDIPDFDLLVGGIPCQSWSAAGLRRVFDDERGQLFFDVRRAMQALLMDS